MNNNNLKNSQTFKNLVKSFAGESQAHIRYKFLEYAAKKEKLYEVSKAIGEIVKNEFNHARMFYSAIQSADPDNILSNVELSSGYPFKEKWNFLENFSFAISNETEENENIYPEFAKIAKQEGFEDIAGLFENVAKVENCHKLMLQEIQAQIKSGTLYKKETPVKFKCSECGHEETLTQAWEKCPLCQAEQGYVKLILKDNQ